MSPCAVERVHTPYPSHPFTFHCRQLTARRQAAVCTWRSLVTSLLLVRAPDSIRHLLRSAWSRFVAFILRGW